MTRIGPTRLLILGRVMQPGLPPTIRELQRLAGFASPNAARLHLEALLAAELIAWEPKIARTIRPRVRFIPADRLGE